MSGSRLPRWQERRADRAYPDFQYGVDSTSGQPLRQTCDPDQLGTYFDQDASRLHYLTPVYFRREVLGRYVSEPSRYRVTGTRLTCLDLWGPDISTNTAGLVEVYLGDLGRDLPSVELPHWLGFNVAPSGQMAEDRFRRDILNQPATANDIPRGLRQAYADAYDASRAFLSQPLWKEPQGPEKREFEALHAPVSDESGALYPPLLTLTKVLVDALEPAVMKSYLGGDSEELKQLQLLDRLVARLNGADSVSAAFRDLYRIRSAGGVAHLAGSDRDKVFRRVGIADMTPAQAFDTLALGLTQALRDLAALFVNATSET